jgi:hypothetical protein
MNVEKTSPLKSALRVSAEDSAKERSEVDNNQRDSEVDVNGSHY